MAPKADGRTPLMAGNGRGTSTTSRRRTSCRSWTGRCATGSTTSAWSRWRCSTVHRPALRADPDRRRPARAAPRRPGPLCPRQWRLHRRGVRAFLAKLGCTYVVVGHSERREYHAETDEVVNAKLKAAYRHGLTPIFCVGEGLEVRQADGHVEHVAQVEAGLDGITAEQAKTIVIAYEPVWAIGTGEVATPQDAQEVCSAIRTKLAELYSGDLADGVRVLYGGSVKANNVAAIMAEEDVDGALVGGASIVPDEFASICRFRTTSRPPEPPRRALRFGRGAERVFWPVLLFQGGVNNVNEMGNAWKPYGLACRSCWSLVDCSSPC